MKQSNGFFEALFFGLLLLLCACFAHSQTPVVLAPSPKLQFFDDNGVPLANGCLFTSQSGTSTPLPTYTNFLGNVQNTNPVVLDSGGYAGFGSSGVWLNAGQAYRFTLVAAGGTNCSLGQTQYTIDGIGGGFTVLTSFVTCATTCNFAILSQNQLFVVTLTGNAVANPLTAVGVVSPANITFEITQDSAGGHSFTWPSNSTGGAVVGQGAGQTSTQFFIWNGSNANAVGPAVTGNGPQLSTGAINATGNISTVSQFISTLITGTPPLVVSSSTLVPNLNASFLESNTWEAPGPIGATTPNTGAFTSFILGGSTPQTGIQGTDTNLLSAGTTTPSAPVGCTDANGGFTTSGCNVASFNAPQRVTLSSPVSLSGGVQAIVLTESVTFPAAAGNYRAQVSYGLYATVGGNACIAEAIDTTNSRAFALSGQDANGSGYIALSAAEVSPQLYAAAASATFTLQIVCNNGAGGLSAATANSGLLSISPAEPTYLSVTPVLSN